MGEQEDRQKAEAEAARLSKLASDAAAWEAEERRKYQQQKDSQK